jgi:hypothetical protein
MSTATRLINAQSSLDTDAEFRTDMLAIHNALIATGGLVQTADTGQTDFTVNTRAAGGYTVYRFNDASQGAYPLFLKIVWTPSASVRAALTIDVGTGSNGSGTITGAFRSGIIFSCSNNGATTDLADNYVSVGEGYLYIALNIWASAPTANNRAAIFFIERSTDESGVVHPEEGVTIFATGNNSRSYSMHPTGFTVIGPAASGSPFLHILNAAFWDDLASSDLGLMPVPYMMRAKMRYHRMVGIKAGRLSYAAAVDATHLGATRKFMPLESNWYWDSSAGWNNVAVSAPGPAFAIPWV